MTQGDGQLTKDRSSAAGNSSPPSVSGSRATDPSSPRPPTIGELEAKYSLYCKALRLLLKEGRTMEAIQRTVCWSRLEQLHICLPGRYKSPDYLYAVLKRDLA
jgi:hypothetical protein